MLIIDDDDTWRTEKIARKLCGTEDSKYTTVQSPGSHDMNFPNIIGEQVVDKIVERVVDKINKEVKPDVRMKVKTEGEQFTQCRWDFTKKLGWVMWSI